jgi:ADP-ribose pyrophosphatase YjhB (NUDIX family)
MNQKVIVASGPVIIEDGKLLVNKDNKDDFYKLPGGTIEENSEDLEEACHREVKEEINGEVEIIRKHIDLVCLGIIFISVLPIILAYIKSKKK